MSRDSEKYSRSVALLCPTCGGSSFETQGGSGEAVRMTKCVSCGREATRDDLIRDNSENISINVKELGAVITRDFADDLRKRLKATFRGSKFIKIK
jgi:hypothetical protein